MSATRRTPGRRLDRRSFFAAARRRPRRGGEKFDAELWRTHGEAVAILAADSSGFSKKTFTHGIVRFLANMTDAYERLVPLIEGHGGQVTTQNADNILAVFRSPAEAVAASVAMHAALARRNARLGAADRFKICIGVHWGEVLRLRDDVYGAPVNVCAKIGEDVARAGETLITDEVVAKLEGRFRTTRAGITTIGGRRIPLHRVRAG